MKGRAGAGILALCAVCVHAGGQVELRTREQLDGRVEDASVAALKMAPEAPGGASRLVSWDRVKRVAGDAGAKARVFEPLMDQLWRARTRVERGDFAAAEILLDELKKTYAAEEGPSAAVVAECTLRCHLARDARGAAASAWLWLTSLVEQKGTAGGTRVEWVGGATNLPALTDAGTGLAPAVPPIWAPGAATQAAATATDWTALKGRGGTAGELAALYEKAARFEAGLDDEASIDDQPGAAALPAVAIVREMVQARGGDAAARDAGRTALRRRLTAGVSRVDGNKVKNAPLPTWMEAWLRTALGLSMIREEDSATRLRGVIELLHVPARFDAEQPNLAGIALAQAAVVMNEIGDADAATALKGELEARHPGHPVLSWEPLSRITGPAPASEGGASKSGTPRALRTTDPDMTAVALGDAMNVTRRRSTRSAIRKGSA